MLGLLIQLIGFQTVSAGWRVAVIPRDLVVGETMIITLLRRGVKFNGNLNVLGISVVILLITKT